MIGYLRGRLRSRDAGRLLIDVTGVGYSVESPASTYLELPPVGEEVELEVETVVRESAFDLYGFKTTSERSTFRWLLTVSGVGPRMALAALSGLGADGVARAIRDGDAKSLSTVPGIGKKTAERMLVDLRDTLPAVADESAPAAAAETSAEALPASGADALSALEHLGYPEKQAARAVRAAMGELSADAGFDELLRDCLQRLSRG
ncbi:MAG: Holliday junction branch migration protein RuvA [Acidobacteriota bacterium]